MPNSTPEEVKKLQAAVGVEPTNNGLRFAEKLEFMKVRTVKV